MAVDQDNRATARMQTFLDSTALIPDVRGIAARACQHGYPFLRGLIHEFGLMPELRVLLLLGIANFAPILATRLLGTRFATPLDGGYVMPDGRPIFGAGKTLRGVLIAILCTTIAAPFLAVDALLGAALAAGAMAGDLLASFCKRRLGLPPHARAFGLDQVPEVLLPVLLLKPWLALAWREVAIVVVVFVLLDILLSRVLYHLSIRERPYVVPAFVSWRAE